MHPFLTATDWAARGQGRFEGEIDPRWSQGRGAYGGVVAAAVLRNAAKLVEDLDRVPRSLTVHFAAPALPGPIALQAQVERRGQRVTHLSARLEQAGGTVGIATVTFTADRPADLRYVHAPMPSAPPWASVEPIPDLPIMPAFTQFFEMRFCLGAAPFSGAALPRTGGWVRPREPLLLDAPLLVGLLDAWPPGVLAVSDRVRAAASVDFTVHFYAKLPRAGAEADAQSLVEMSSRWAADGYSEERRTLWGEDGQLLGDCRQMLAVLG